MERDFPKFTPPAASTASEVLKRHGLVKACPQRSRRTLRRVSALVAPSGPNDCWSADHKGNFPLGNGVECYPLTVTDNFTRFLFHCEASSGTDGAVVQRAFERLFLEYGMPRRIRTDNGSPFGASRGLALSKLSLWWMRLGITHERIRAGRPQQNGRHERMHRTLKQEATIPPSRTMSAQQRRFEAFVTEYNHERPHEALGGRTPASLYEVSPRQMPTHLPPLSYPPDFLRRKVAITGYFSFEARSYFLSKVLAREDIGLKPLDSDELQIWAGHLPLGVLRLRKRALHLYDEAEQSKLGSRHVLPIVPD
jgi:transposase InsO family protein